MTFKKFMEFEWLSGEPKKLSMDDILIKKIVNKYLEKDTEKLHSPTSDEYFIMDKINEIYICISDSSIQISNHTFHYNKQVNLSYTDELKNTIRKQIDIEREVLKKELFKNEVDLLHKINEL